MAPNTTTSTRCIRATELEPATFAPFGTVVQNPATHNGRPARAHIEANQGSATKWLDVSGMRGFYELAPSRKAAEVIVSMFVCRPRELRKRAEHRHGRGTTQSTSEEVERYFDVNIFERHPFTPQMFVPIGLEATDRSTAYLVIVAPTLPIKTRGSEESASPPYPIPGPRRRRSLREILTGARPNPFTNDFEARTTPATLDGAKEAIMQKPKGAGYPDLANVRAFIARGDQAVTYGPGTWHAPMVVLGERPIEFVVVQHANGVGLEDCQEIEVITQPGSEGLCVEIGELGEEEDTIKSKL